MNLSATVLGGLATAPVRSVLGGVGKVVANGVGSTLTSTGLNAVGDWVLSGTEAGLRDLAKLMGSATSPDLTGTWFSATYWRVASLAALLMVPFVFAATLQALLRSEPALLAKVVFAYVPLSALAVSIAAPLTMLLLGATDQMCNVVSATAINGASQLLDRAAVIAGGLSGVTGSPFLAVVVAMMTLAAALTLTLELLVREAAVYVVVLMLPLAFAAFVWPARRIWAIRLVELLISLILSKFVIVAVLSLAASAFSVKGTGVAELLTAMALVLLSTFAPWALMRILPFTELAAGAAGALRQELPQAGHRIAGATSAGFAVTGDPLSALPAILRSHADQAGQGHAAVDDAQLSTPQATGARSTAPETAAGMPAAQHTPAPSTTGPSPESTPVPPTDSDDDRDQPPEYRHPLADIDPELRFNAGPGGWWSREE